MNTHESYVSLETAQMLKEAGFDWECYATYNIQDGKFDFRGCSDNWNVKLSRYASAPTLDVAQRWLREVKGYELWVYPFSTHYRFSFYGYLANEDNNTNFDTYEKALEAGIKKVLEVILEKGE